MGPHPNFVNLDRLCFSKLHVTSPGRVLSKHPCIALLSFSSLCPLLEAPKSEAVFHFNKGVQAEHNQQRT